MKPPSRRPAMVLALAAIATFAAGLPSSCSTDHRTRPVELVEAMTRGSAELRDRVEEHREWFEAAQVGDEIAELEAEDATRMHAEMADVLDALYSLDACSKEGWSRETVVLSDLVGQIEEAIDTHGTRAAQAATRTQLVAEERAHALALGKLLDQLDAHLVAAGKEATQRPFITCGKRQTAKRAAAKPLS